MNNKTIWVSLLAAGSLALAGCNPSSSDNGDGDGNGDGNGAPPGNGSGEVEASIPAESDLFFRAAELNYNTLYSGSDDWAVPTNLASAEAGSAEDQEQRIVADTSLLANALMMVPFYFDQALIREYDLDEDDFYQVYGLSTCADNDGTISLDSGTGTVDNYCLSAERGDGADLVVDGTFSYESDPGSDYTRQAVFDGLTIEWRGENFTASGKIADAVNEFTEGPVSAAMDVDHVGGDAFRFWAGHVYVLSREQPQINMIGFHPDLGGLAQLAEGMYADADNCADGAFDADAGSTLNGPDDASYTMAFAHCNLYGFATGQSRDSGNNEPVPEYYAAYLSLGMDFGPSVSELTAAENEQFKMAMDQSDSLTVTQPETARLGESFDANGDGQYYELALTIDLSEIDSIAVDDVKAALIRVYQVDATEDSATGILRARRVDYDGDPSAAEFIGDDTNDLESAAVSLDSDWLTIDATEMLKDARAAGDSKLQLVVTANYGFGDPDEGDRYREFCLSEGSSCESHQLPAASVGYVE